MAGHGNRQPFWAHHNAQNPAANVQTGHKDTNVYYHFRTPPLVLGLYLNEGVDGRKVIGTYLRGFKGEDKTVSRPRLAQHQQQQLMGALRRVAVANNDAPPRQHDDVYGDYSVFHEIDIDNVQYWQQMSDWVREHAAGVHGHPRLPQPVPR